MNCYADRTESWLTMMGRGSEREDEGRYRERGKTVKRYSKIGQSGMIMKYNILQFPFN